MARTKSRKGYEYNNSFVMLGRRMLFHCDEWKVLSPSAKLLYLYLKARFNGSNNGKIRLSYSALSGIKGISSSATISKAMKELEESGWINRTKIGGLYRNNNEFRLTAKFDECLYSRY